MIWIFIVVKIWNPASLLEMEVILILLIIHQ
jgi:hypothetical protein